MKPFDLEAALKGAPITTTNGKEIISWHYFAEVTDYIEYPILIYIEDDTGPKKVKSHSFTKEGRYIEGKSHNLDLVMAPVKRKAWISIKKGQIDMDAANRFVMLNSTEAEAVHWQADGALPPIKIEWEE